MIDIYSLVKLVLFGGETMIVVIYIAQAILCLVSVILTGLFALSVAGIQLVGAVQDTENRWLFAGILFVFIGVCMDVSKYLFWAESVRSRYFRVISLSLMVFSWFASVSFFISTESISVNQARMESPQYRLISSRIYALQQELTVNKRILKRRLSSQYHKQWSLSEVNLSKIAQLQTMITESQREQEILKMDDSIGQSTSVVFFKEVEDLLGVSASIVRWVGFGLLALLLEICTLASISLVISYRSVIPDKGKDTEFDEILEESDKKEQRSIKKLKHDIQMGNVEPVIRKIRQLNYGLSFSSIKILLNELKEVGAIEKDKRNSYRRKLDN